MLPPTVLGENILQDMHGTRGHATSSCTDNNSYVTNM